MATVTFGGRLVLLAGGQRVVLRVLREAVLTDAWEVPVLADIAVLGLPPGTVEVVGEDGANRLPAHLSFADGRLMLRAGLPEDESPALLQRRDDVRGRLPLPVRGAVLGGHGDEGDSSFAGITVSISAGGVAVAVPTAGLPLVPAGSVTFLELELPDGAVVPAVVHVVDHGDGCLRGRFVDIAAADREKLVRLVFAEERRNLAARAKIRRQL
jgi:hypothetical protein